MYYPAKFPFLSGFHSMRESRMQYHPCICTACCVVHSISIYHKPEETKLDFQCPCACAGSCSDFSLLMQTLFPDVKVKRVASFTQKVAERLIDDDISDLDDVNDSEHELISKCPRFQMLAVANKGTVSRKRRNVRRYTICDDLDFVACTQKTLAAGPRRANTFSMGQHISSLRLPATQPSHTHLRRSTARTA